MSPLLSASIHPLLPQRLSNRSLYLRRNAANGYPHLLMLQYSFLSVDSHRLRDLLLLANQCRSILDTQAHTREHRQQSISAVAEILDPTFI